MNKEALLKKIARAAERDRKRRKDPRFLNVMGFLVAKGFLKANWNLPLFPNQRIAIRDAIWAGKYVEPRILEVLPAAVLRLPRHFDLDAEEHPDLHATIERLKKGEENGEGLWGIAYRKLLPWVHLPLLDGRVKTFTEKKVTKTFRLQPVIVERLKTLASELGCTETEALERSILKIQA